MPTMEQPLGLRLARALESGGFEQRVRLRGVGDFSLFMSGFFSDSFARRSVDVDYYRSLGECAYGVAQPIGGRGIRRGICRVVAQVRRLHGRPGRHQRSHDRSASTTEVLRIYEKWLRTGSERDGQRLVERGIVPNMTIGRRFIQ